MCIVVGGQGSISLAVCVGIDAGAVVGEGRCAALVQFRLIGTINICVDSVTGTATLACT